MKKMIIATLLAAMTPLAFAAAGCDGTGKGTKQVAVPNVTFNSADFTPACSANVFMQVELTVSTSQAYAAAGSKKGSCYWVGHSDAGVAQKTPTCSPSNNPEIDGKTDPSPIAADALKTFNITP